MENGRTGGLTLFLVGEEWDLTVEGGYEWSRNKNKVDGGEEKGRPFHPYVTPVTDTTFSKRMKHEAVEKSDNPSTNKAKASNL